MGMIAKPVAGMIADKFSLLRFIFLFGLFLTGLGYCSLMFVPNIVPDLTSQLDCSSPLSLLKVCRPGAAVDSLELPEVLNCSLTCPSTSSLCSAFSLPDCEDSEDSEAGLLNFTVRSNLSQHDTQPVPGCLYVPLDFVTSNNSTHVRPVCSPSLSVECQASCGEEKVHDFIRQDSVFSSPSFWLFFGLNIIAYSSFGVVTSLADAICFEQLEGRHQDYGYQRVWGSIGWGLFTVIAGFLVDQGSEGVNKDYSPAFILLTSLLLVDLFLTSLSLKISSPERSSVMTAEMLRLVSTPRVTLFVVWCAVCGALQGLYWNWLPWYLAHLATARAGEDWLTLLIGLNMGVQCFVGEVPMFFLSGWIINRLGHANTMTLVLGVFGIRSLLYTLLTNPWYSLLIEVLNGVTFGIFYATMTSYAHILSPPGGHILRLSEELMPSVAGLESTMQGIVGAAFEGLGVAVGTLVGGAVYKALSGRWLFGIFGFLSIVFCAIHAAIHFILLRKENHHPDDRDYQKEATGFSLVRTSDTK